MTTAGRARGGRGGRPAVDRGDRRSTATFAGGRRRARGGSAADPPRSLSRPPAVGGPAAVVGGRPLRPRRSIFEEKVTKLLPRSPRRTWRAFAKNEMSADLANARGERGGRCRTPAGRPPDARRTPATFAAVVAGVRHDRRGRWRTLAATAGRGILAKYFMLQTNIFFQAELLVCYTVSARVFNS